MKIYAESGNVKCGLLGFDDGDEELLKVITLAEQKEAEDKEGLVISEAKTSIDWWNDLANMYDRNFCMVQEDGKPIGFIQLGLSEDPVHITSAYIQPDFRGHRFVDILFAACFNYLVEKTKHRLVGGEVFEKNTAALRSVERNGFQDTLKRVGEDHVFRIYRRDLSDWKPQFKPTSVPETNPLDPSSGPG